MKKILIIAFALSLSAPTSAQIINDTLIFFKMTKVRGIDNGIKYSARGILDQNRKGFKTDSLIYFTNRLERAVLAGKSSGKLSPQIVKKGRELHPGRNKNAIIQRLKFYAKEAE